MEKDLVEKFATMQKSYDVVPLLDQCHKISVTDLFLFQHGNTPKDVELHVRDTAEMLTDKLIQSYASEPTEFKNVQLLQSAQLKLQITKVMQNEKKKMQLKLKQKMHQRQAEKKRLKIEAEQRLKRTKSQEKLQKVM